MLSFEEARDLILRIVPQMETEETSLLEALGRACAEDVIAPRDMPLFDNSAMDGYAVRAVDCSPDARLPVRGYIPAGAAAEEEIPAGAAVKIMTGAPIPPGSDAVVPFEETLEEPDRITLTGEVRRNDHIRFRGEDIRRGETAIPSGTTLRPPEISLLATFGKETVRVRRRPRVAVLSTGDELVELGQELPPGGIVNSNSWSLAASLKEIGAEPVMLGIARDTAESLREKLSEGLEYDVLITSAGVSAGDRDMVREILEELNVRELFWKVDIKPGRPTAFGMRGKTPVFSLPGNPVSTMVTFEEFVRPALLRMMGHRKILKPTIRAALKEPAAKKPGRIQFMRVMIEVEDGRLMISSAGDQNTGILRTMIRANGIAVLPAERSEFAAGEEVDVHLLGGAESLQKS